MINLSALAERLTAGDFEKTCTDLMPFHGRVDPDWEAFRKLWSRAKERALFFPASTKYHGVWPGGFADHLNDMLIYVVKNEVIYGSKMNYAQWAVTVLLHDWEKLWKYVWDEPKARFDYAMFGKSGWSEGVITPAFRIGAWLQWSGVTIVPEMLNALTMSEGGWSMEARVGREAESSGSAALLHAADMFSAKTRKTMPSRWALEKYPAFHDKSWANAVACNEFARNLEKEFPAERVLWPS